MKERLKLFGTIGLFWTGFFIFCRILFLVYHFDQTSQLTAGEIFTVLLLGLRMDLAMAAYWLILSGLLFSLPLVNGRVLYFIHTVVTMLLIVISCIIVVVDLELYLHWGFRMNTTPLFYLSTEAAGSVNPLRGIILAAIFIVLVTGTIAIALRIARKISMLPVLPLKWVPVMLVIAGCLFVPIRSSFTVAPLNTSAVYFHKTKSFPNHAGINVVWNFFNSLSAKDQLKYPTTFYKGDASSVLQELESSGSNKSVLSAVHPNVILIILESFTANIIQPLGGMEGVTPQFNSLVHEGILFDHFYASGDRTDKGLIALLSSYPAQPRTSIIRFPQKTEHLPFLSRALQRQGYHTSFVYGGDVAFANMESYLTTAGFSHITDDDDFSTSLNNSKWGVADQYVFDRLAVESDTAKTPFFKVMLSLSSHEPFEVPAPPFFRGHDERALFLNACHYTDSSLGEFIKKAKQSSWWKNTLVVITADHGHRFPNSTELKEKERFKIPMLWIGGAVQKQDTIIKKLGGQTDLASSLLSQLGVEHCDFKFGKNILDTNAKSFAVYIFQNGFGYLDPESEFVYDFDFQKYSRETGSPQVKQNGKAYMQSLFSDYNSR